MGTRWCTRSWSPFINVFLFFSVVRAQSGAGQLQLNSKLCAAAQVHSQDMANGHFMDHTGSNGSKFSDRISGQGYRGRTMAENVAYLSLENINLEAVKKVFDNWMNSPGHAQNIRMYSGIYFF
jgi:uncharacterized protein YkwD